MTSRFVFAAALGIWLTAMVSGEALEQGNVGSGVPLLFVTPAAPVPGDVISIVSPGRRAPARVDLVDAASGRSIASAVRIDVSLADSGSAGLYLLGIDSATATGTYIAEGFNESGDRITLRWIEVGERRFRREDIVLNETLTSLRADYDPRKDEESRVLGDILFSADGTTLYEPGALAWPLPSDTRRTSLYGDRRTYLYSGGDESQSIHAGLDLAMPTGTPVASSGAGIVRMARARIVTGNTVVIEHAPGVYTLYYHLSALHVAEGDVVARGQEIGLVGMTGLATGPHLHWELRVGGVAVDPESATARPLLPPGALRHAP